MGGMQGRDIRQRVQGEQGREVGVGSWGESGESREEQSGRIGQACGGLPGQEACGGYC